MKKRPVPHVQRLLGQYPSLEPEIQRLTALGRPARPSTPPAEQLLLVPPAQEEGRKPRRIAGIPPAPRTNTSK